MVNRIESMINDIEEYIGNCKAAPFSSNKILVDKEQIEELLRELRIRTPEEIKKYQKLISNKDAIIADAQEQANSILNNAKIQTQELINEHEIMQRAYSEAEQIREEAYAQAQLILNQATEEANNMRLGAVSYTDDMLANLQMIIEHSIESNRVKYEGLLNALDKDLKVVISNRNELAGINQESDTVSQTSEDTDTSDNNGYYE